MLKENINELYKPFSNFRISKVDFTKMINKIMVDRKKNRTSID